MEALLGVTIFAIFLGALAITIIYGQESTIIAGDRTRATYLTERNLAGIRSIRDGSFSSVSAGQYGVWVNHSGVWAFSGTKITLSGSYISTITISSLASDWLSMTGSTYWKHGYNRAGTATLVTELTNWQTKKSIGNWASPSLEGSYVPGGSPLFNRIAISGNTAYVGTNASNGLYLLDITNTASPARVSSSFSIGYAAADVVVKGKRLYVLTTDPSAEVKLYSITSAQSPVLLASYNLPGSALGTSLGLGRNNLYVTAATPGAGQHQIYSFDATNSGSLALEGTFDDTDDANMIALSGTSAYIASSVDTAELRVVNAYYSGSLALVGAYNLTDRTLNGTAIALAGTSAILGTQAGSSIQEMVLFDIGTGGVPTGSSGGPWYHEASGSVVGAAIDPYQCYGFLGVSSGHKALQVVDIRSKATLPQLASYDSATGLGRSLAYDVVRDRLYLMTDSAVLIFKPSAVGGTCP
jgi:hypothetical protein